MMIVNAKKLAEFTLKTTNGEFGRILDIYFDDRNWGLKYISVETGTWFFGNRVAIKRDHIHSVDLDKSILQIDISNEEVKNIETIAEHKPVYLQMKDRSDQTNAWFKFGSAGMGYPTTGMVKGLSETTEMQQNSYDQHLRSCEHITDYSIYDTSGAMGEVSDFLISTDDWRIEYVIYSLINDVSNQKYIISPKELTNIDFENRALRTAIDFSEGKNLYADNQVPVID